MARGTDPSDKPLDKVPNKQYALRRRSRASTSAHLPHVRPQKRCHTARLTQYKSVSTAMRDMRARRNTTRHPRAEDSKGARARPVARNRPSPVTHIDKTHIYVTYKVTQREKRSVPAA